MQQDKQFSRGLRRDWDVRVAAISWLEERRQQTGTAVHGWRDLVGGFPCLGDRVKLKHPQLGIHRPSECVYPISITTSLKDPYGDVHREAAGELRYRYKGRPRSPAGSGLRGRLSAVDNVSNRGLRCLMRRRWPLIHLRAVASGEYLAVAPVVILNDDPETQTFGVGLGADPAVYAGLSASEAIAAPSLPEPWLLDQGRYQSGAALHVDEGVFRHRILAAYRGRCAACSVSPPGLLDAVRILPSAGGYDTPNGLSLCKLHHAAYDRNYLGIAPDYRVEIGRGMAAAARETGTAAPCAGPRTQSRILLPYRRVDRPSSRFLEVRYEAFRASERMRSSPEPRNSSGRQPK